MNTITIHTIINAPIEKVWEYWNGVDHFAHWAFASDEWAAKGIQNDVNVGGKINIHNFAKDKSAEFYFEGTYTAVKEHELLEFVLTDGRHVSVVFESTPNGVTIQETFEPENENPLEMQKSGWQAYLDNFKKYVERKSESG